MVSVIEFCRRRAPEGIGRWPKEVLGRWLTSRAAAGELKLQAVAGRPTALVAVRRDADQNNIHVWAAIGDMQWLATVTEQWSQQWPDWQEGTVTGLRRGQMRELRRLLERLMKPGERREARGEGKRLLAMA